MTEKIKLVQGDTRPRIVLTVKDIKTQIPLDLSSPGTEVRLKFRPVGSTVTKAVLTCIKIAGIQADDLSISLSAPYNVAGAGGRAYVPWTAASLDTAGDFEGEVETLFADGSVQTVFEILKFKVRPQF